MANKTNNKLCGRTLARAQAMQLMFQAESVQESLADLLKDDDYLVTDGPALPYAVELAEQASVHAQELDARIVEASKNWDASRIGRSERLLMRLALYEALYCLEIDDAVAISEAVKLAKMFGADDAYTFVNGILGAVIRKERA